MLAVVTHPSSHHPTPGASNPSYDVVHLSARNARLEEKLSKALAKNRSMAKYYDQLLAKTRDAQEREIEDLKADLMRAQADAAAWAHRSRAQGDRITAVTPLGPRFFWAPA